MEYKKKVWSDNSSVSAEDFNRIEDAIAALAENYDKLSMNSCNSDIDKDVIHAIVSDYIVCHEADGQAHAVIFQELYNQNAYSNDEVSLEKQISDQKEAIDKLDKKVKALDKVISQLKKELKELSKVDEVDA